MAKILHHPEDKIAMIELDETELDQLLEVSIGQGFTVNEVILAAFKIGLIQLVAKTMRDKGPT